MLGRASLEEVGTFLIQSIHDEPRHAVGDLGMGMELEPRASIYSLAMTYFSDARVFGVMA